MHGCIGPPFIGDAWEPRRRRYECLMPPLPPTFVPDNKPMFVVDPINNVMWVDPAGNQIGWDGPVFGDLQISTLNRGRIAYAEPNGQRDL